MAKTIRVKVGDVVKRSGSGPEFPMRVASFRPKSLASSPDGRCLVRFVDFAGDRVQPSYAGRLLATGGVSLSGFEFASFEKPAAPAPDVAKLEEEVFGEPAGAVAAERAEAFRSLVERVVDGAPARVKDYDEPAVETPADLEKLPEAPMPGERARPGFSPHLERVTRAWAKTVNATVRKGVVTKGEMLDLLMGLTAGVGLKCEFSPGELGDAMQRNAAALIEMKANEARSS